MSVSKINAIQELEREMLKHPQLDLEVTHHFAPGIYARELFIPEGVLLTGKVHKTEHMNILASGRIEIAGQGELIGPLIFTSAPGTKRAGYAHEDSTWITIHATTETDIPTLEHELVECLMIEDDT